jgi:hypothetical protein
MKNRLELVHPANGLNSFLRSFIRRSISLDQRGMGYQTVNSGPLAHILDLVNTNPYVRIVTIHFQTFLDAHLCRHRYRIKLSSFENRAPAR